MQTRNRYVMHPIHSDYHDYRPHYHDNHGCLAQYCLFLVALLDFLFPLTRIESEKVMNIGKIYGRSIAFPPRIGADGQWAWSEGSQNIRESIQVILQTELGERLMLRPFGAGLGRYLFEANSVSTRSRIQEQVQNALQLWEKRIRLEALRVDEDSQNPSHIIITIEYQLVATGETERLALNLTLQS